MTGPTDFPRPNSPEDFVAIGRAVIDKERFQSRGEITSEFLRTELSADVDRATQNMVLRMRAEFWTFAMTPRVTHEQKVVAHVPDGRWQMFRAALGLAHKTRAVMADVETKIVNVVPVGLSAIGPQHLSAGDPPVFSYFRGGYPR